jgi:hypothetical protein
LTLQKAFCTYFYRLFFRQLKSWGSFFEKYEGKLEKGEKESFVELLVEGYKAPGWEERKVNKEFS